MRRRRTMARIQGGPATAARDMRLLVLDDDAVTARLTSRIANAAGFVTTVANDADTIREKYGEALPEVIMLDLLLGQTNGVEQLRALSAWRYPGSLILMSGSDDQTLAAAGTLARCLGLHVAATLGKPIDVPQLRQVLAKLLA